MVERYGWPQIGLKQWRCSAAQAAAVSLPRGLDDALAAMQLALQKDASGAKVMKKMMKPRKARKAEREEWAERYGAMPMGVLYHENRHLLDQLFEYVKQDVLAEEGLSYMVPDLTPYQLATFQLDQIVNDRGFTLDMEAVQAALYLLGEEAADLNGELALLTGGKVVKATQRKQLTVWLASEGLELENTQAATLDELLEVEDWANDIRLYVASPAAKRAIQILRTLGRSSTAKYETASKWVDPHDDKMRGGLLYHAASTGRWGGKGFQPQNLPKGTLVVPKEEGRGEFVERLWDTVKQLDRDNIRSEFGNVLQTLSHGLRSTIIASPGKTLYVADYNAIEARVLQWLAENEEALAIFRAGKDIYLELGPDVYGRTITKADEKERSLCKAATLGLGYQMGAPKFVDTVARQGIVIEEDFAQRIVTAFRTKFWRVKKMWGDQEAAAIKAVQTKRPVEMGRMLWLIEGVFLYCELPSGRRIAYPYPTVSMQETSWGSQKLTLQFKSVHPKIKKWVTTKTYGGAIVENQCQSVAYDLMAEAMLRLEDSGTYTPILSVHDEAIAEADIGTGNVKEFEQLVATMPEWAEDMPVTAEGWAGFRYRK